MDDKREGRFSAARKGKHVVVVALAAMPAILRNLLRIAEARLRTTRQQRWLPPPSFALIAGTARPSQAARSRKPKKTKAIATPCKPSLTAWRARQTSPPVIDQIESRKRLPAGTIDKTAPELPAFDVHAPSPRELKQGIGDSGRRVKSK